MKKIVLYCLGIIVLLIVTAVFYFRSVAIVHPPIPKNSEVTNLQRVKLGSDFYVLKNSWIKKSNSGLWEMYVEAEDPYERGLINGKLAQELVQLQEVYFIRQIKKLIPSQTYLNYLKYAIAWFNRDLDKFVTEEYKQEIYGVSTALNDEYDFIGSKYQRSLNYHAAHDIGHALQDKNMVVGCTAFSTWNAKSSDGNLLIARNFDFYVGDDFAKDKVVCFYNPIHGNKFVFITWGGFVGAVSGMNDKGLTVTINASKSDIPSGSATPISLVAREILQYASTIQEAKTIADKRKTFVSESLFIGSAKEGKTSTIEKSPTQTGLLETNENYIICSNNFQSKIFENDPVNIENKKSSSSIYRFKRMKQLIDSYAQIGPREAAEILRNREGLNNENIGLGNEKSINQLIAHHSVIMEPAKGLIWVSTQPFQLGKYICYDLNKVFSSCVGLKEKKEIYEESLTLQADSFLYTNSYANFKRYKLIATHINNCVKNKSVLSSAIENAFIISNPEQYEVYSLLGDYYSVHKNNFKAIYYYKLALSKEIPLQKEAQHITEQLQKCEQAN
jgi:isopenicillin-N N-acyltransferase-like protein